VTYETDNIYFGYSLQGETLTAIDVNGNSTVITRLYIIIRGSWAIIWNLFLSASRSETPPMLSCIPGKIVLRREANTLNCGGSLFTLS